MNISPAALTACRFRIPDLPIGVWMLLGAVVVGIGGDLEAPQLLSLFNAGWGSSLGDFALILLPSFILASALSRRPATGAAVSATATGPIAAAGMVCPDTAYAALAPIARGRKLQLAFGAYSGFKLLFPAGPLLVATGLGIDGMKALGFGVLLCLPAWAVGLLWARRLSPPELDGPMPRPDLQDSPIGSFAPFAVLIGLILTGMMFDLDVWPSVDFLTRPPGALASAALLALTGLPAEQRRECLDTGIRRTGSLLFLIGAASALGAVLVEVVPIANHVSVTSGMSGLLAIVGLTSLFKLVQGSSMATFAAVTPFVAPFLAAGNLPPDAMVLAVCVGSLIAVLPNDSFYWLVRQDAFASRPEHEALVAIAGGTLLQGLVGIAGLVLLQSLDVLG